jgi:hypothetical protein
MKAFSTVSCLVVGGLFAVLNTACSMETVGSQDVKPEVIHQDYSVTYREANGSTEYTAQFRVGGWSGTTVELQSPANLKINGQSPGKSTVFGTMYESSTAGFVPSTTFEYTAADGKVSSNSISIDRVTLGAVSPMLTLNQSFVVPATAPGLSAGETITAEITQAGGDNQTTMVVGSFDPARGQISFSLSDLNRLRNGSATLQVYRTKTLSLTQATSEGGTISANYYARPVNLTVAGAAIPSMVQN